jgi:hypothetical protein
MSAWSKAVVAHDPKVSSVSWRPAAIPIRQEVGLVISMVPILRVLEVSAVLVGSSALSLAILAADWSLID